MRQISKIMMLVFCTISNICKSSDNSLEYPFAFRQLSKKELACTTLFLQRGFTIIDDEQTKFAFSGPFCPCKGLFIKNIATNKTICFHLDWSNSISKSAEIAKKRLNIINPQDIRLILFSTQAICYETKFKILHSGLDQQIEFKRCAQEIKKQLDIKKHQIKSHYFDATHINDDHKYLIIENGSSYDFPKVYQNSISFDGFANYRLSKFIKIHNKQAGGIFSRDVLCLADIYNSTQPIEFKKSVIQVAQKHSINKDISATIKQLSRIETIQYVSIGLASLVASIIIGTIACQLYAKRQFH